MSLIQIEAKPVTHVEEWAYFTVSCLTLVLNERAIFSTTFYNSDNKIVDSFKDVVEGEEYHNWSNDDDYILNLIAQRYGVSRIISDPTPV